MSPPVQKRCRGGGHDGQIITSALAEQQCIKEEGTPVPISDGGGSNRITTGVLDSSLTVPGQNDAARPRGLTNMHTAERLFLFPICSLHREFPRAELLNRLDSFNQNFAHEVGRIVKTDARLKQSIFQLLLDMSSIAASALELTQTKSATTFTVPEEFIERAEAVAHSIRSHTSDTRLVSELTRLVELGKELRGTRLSDLISKLGSGRASAS